MPYQVKQGTPHAGGSLLIDVGGTNCGPWIVPNVVFDPQGDNILSINADGSICTTPMASATGGFPYLHVNANGTGVVKAAPGTLLAVTINTKGATGNTLTLYDNTTATGAVIAVIDTTVAPGSIPYDLAFATGLSYAMATGSAADITLTFK
jgi:hypothetical protein